MIATGMTDGMEVTYARIDALEREAARGRAVAGWRAWRARPAPQAVSPSGSGRPSDRQQAVTVLASRQAMVIGPTPPGTGVIAPATSARRA